MADSTYDVVAAADDAGQNTLGGGGQIASRSSENLDPLAGAASVIVGQWPSANWGPKLYTFDATGRRTAAPAPGE
jgi:hypothetical protein